MYSLIIKNKDGLKLEFNSLRAAYNITNIKGLYPPKTTINTSQSALVDGSTFNSAKVNSRSINMAFTIEYPVESNRLAIYKVLRPKEPITMYYKSSKLDVYIEGYVESIEVGHFDVKQKATISILCPQPYLKSAAAVVDELTNLIRSFHFPFYNPVEEQDLVFGHIEDTAQAIVVNNGGIETGIVIEIFCKNNAFSNPTIYNYDTQEYIALDYTFEVGETVVINTVQGEKSITSIKNGIHTNIFNSLVRGSTWLQLPAGGATYVYTVEPSGSEQFAEITISHNDLYEGV